MIKITFFLLGMVSLVLLISWIGAGILFIFGDSPHPGVIVSLPRWVFAPSIFVLLFYRSKPVKELFTKIEKTFF